MKQLRIWAIALGPWISTLAAETEESEKQAAFNGSPVVAEGSALTLVSAGFQFTEGPARDAEGDVFFTDQPNDRIHHWSAESGAITVFQEPSGRSNGLYVSADGALIACADEKNALWRIDVESKMKEVLLDEFDGLLLNGPNDVWLLDNGDLYFTDPFYKRPYWKRGEREQDGQHVYFLKKGAKSARRVISDLVQPNGIVGNAREATLFVADIGDKKTYRYHIEKDGSLSGKTKVIDMGSDGMTLDAAGNLYLTGKGVTVVDPRGKKIEHIPVPENWTANACFAGKDRNILFITAMDSVYTLAMKVAGEE